jgi:hypothetical protein
MEASKAQVFGDSFIGTRLEMRGDEWTVKWSFPGDSGVEEDCFLVLINATDERYDLHYEEYHDGENEDGEIVGYPDGEPYSVTVRREEQAEDEEVK